MGVGRPDLRRHGDRDHQGAAAEAAGKDEKKIDTVGKDIIALREEKKNILTEAAGNKEIAEHMEDMAAFLGEQTTAVTEYSEALVRRLIEKIVVYDEKLVVEFKSGLSVEVDA